MNIINKVVLIGILLFFTAINISCSQTKADNIISLEKADKINEIVSLYSDYEGFNGSILVAYEGKIIYEKGFGLANMEWEIPNQVDTKFQIASITKQFTAMLIMQLVSENKLDLHYPISTYLPDYPNENGEQITIHHLLTHSSGIADVRHDEKYFRPIEMVNQFADEPLQFTPGEQFSYSNSGYTLLGYIIETITNKSYEEVLGDNILKPLNMKNTGFYKHRPIIKNMSSGYNKVWGDYFNIDYSDESSAYAAGAIYSTVEDLFLWDQALYTEKLLPKKYMDLIFSKHIAASFGGHYGYGMELTDKPIGNTTSNIETIGHSGTISGYCALFTRIPSSNSTIIFLNNTRRAFLNAMTTAITGILYDKPYNFPLKPLAKFMSEAIKNEGIEKGIMFYKEHKDLDDYYVSEQELIVAGYKLLHTGNTEYAAEVFKLSTEVFPNKDNPYDSYGEVLLVLGDTIKAIKNYKKSLELNPDNENGKEILKKLGVDYKKDELNLLETDSTWKKEIFHFPIHFAPEIGYHGVEDARFPLGWRKKDSPEFWSYAFAWNINLANKLTVTELETNLKLYFDGLMNVVNKDKKLVLPNTTAQFHEKESSKTISKYTGKVEIFDAFVTKKPMTLNVLVESHYSKQKNKTIILFRFSPKEFGDDIWIKLEKVKLSADIHNKA